jgi:hypothetical protein
MYCTRYPCQIVMKLEFYRQIFEKSLSIKFRQNPSHGSRVVPCGQRDGRTNGYNEAESLLEILRTRLKKGTALPLLLLYAFMACYRVNACVWWGSEINPSHSNFHRYLRQFIIHIRFCLQYTVINFNTKQFIAESEKIITYGNWHVKDSRILLLWPGILFLLKYTLMFGWCLTWTVVSYFMVHWMRFVGIPLHIHSKQSTKQMENSNVNDTADRTAVNTISVFNTNVTGM